MSRFIALPLVLIAAAAIHAVDLPRKAPDFTIQMNGAKPLQLSQYKGKSVVLAFILTTCTHCQKAVKCLTADAPQYAPRGLQVLAAAVERDAADHVPEFQRIFKPAFPVGYSTDSDGVLRFMQHPANMVPHMPLIAFIDRAGV